MAPTGTYARSGTETAAHYVASIAAQVDNERRWRKDLVRRAGFCAGVAISLIVLEALLVVSLFSALDIDFGGTAIGGWVFVFVLPIVLAALHWQLHGVGDRFTARWYATLTMIGVILIPLAISLTLSNFLGQAGSDYLAEDQHILTGGTLGGTALDSSRSNEIPWFGSLGWLSSSVVTIAFGFFFVVSLYVTQRFLGMAMNAYEDAQAIGSRPPQLLQILQSAEEKAAEHADLYAIQRASRQAFDEDLETAYSRAASAVLAQELEHKRRALTPRLTRRFNAMDAAFASAGGDEIPAHIETAADLRRHIAGVKDEIRAHAIYRAITGQQDERIMP